MFGMLAVRKLAPVGGRGVPIAARRSPSGESVNPENVTESGTLGSRRSVPVFERTTMPETPSGSGVGT